MINVRNKINGKFIWLSLIVFTLVFSLLVLNNLYIKPNVISSDNNSIKKVEPYSVSNLVMTIGQNPSELNFTWYTKIKEKSLIQVAEQPENTELQAKFLNSYNCSVMKIDNSIFNNKVTVSGLKSDTNYIYRIGDGNGSWTKSYTFKTQNTEKFNFIAVGDPQIGALELNSDTSSWKKTLDYSLNKFKNTSFILSTGDQVNISSDESQFKGFLTPNQLTSTPLVPVIGNHDVGALNILNHFNIKEFSPDSNQISKNYNFTYGNSLFIVLDTNYETTEYKQYIEDTIEDNHKTKWKILILHNSIYGSGYHTLEEYNQILKNILIPVIDRHRIDIVISGHDHTFARSYIMKNDSPIFDSEYSKNGLAKNPSGTIYISLNSSTGSKYYELNPGAPDYTAKRFQNYTPTFSNISIDNNQLIFDTYSIESGKLIDSCKIYKDTD